MSSPVVENMEASRGGDLVTISTLSVKLGLGWLITITCLLLLVIGISLRAWRKTYCSGPDKCQDTVDTTDTTFDSFRGPPPDDDNVSLDLDFDRFSIDTDLGDPTIDVRF